MKILNLDGQLEILTYQQLLTFLTDVYLTVFANILSEKRIKEAVTEAVTFSQFSTLIFDRVGNSKWEYVLSKQNRKVCLKKSNERALKELKN